MSASGNWFITPHAVRRYIERHRPELTYERALYELTLWSEIAVFYAVDSTGFHEMRAEFPARIRFIVSPVAIQELPVLVTVLPRGRKPRWVNAQVDAEMTFRRLEGFESRQDRIEMLMRQWLAQRRVTYMQEKRANSMEYKKILWRARQTHARFRADPNRVALRIAADRMYHTKRRAEILSAKPVCMECGAPVTERHRMGRISKYCSTICSTRRAGREYWRRLNPRPDIGPERGRRHWTKRELAALTEPVSSRELAARLKRSLSSVQQKRVALGIRALRPDGSDCRATRTGHYNASALRTLAAVTR